MKIINPLSRPLISAVLALTWLTTSIQAQTVSIPDAGLNAAIRATLGKTNGPLTQQDLLSLTSLDASRRNVRSTKNPPRISIRANTIGDCAEEGSCLLY